MVVMGDRHGACGLAAVDGDHDLGGRQGHRLRLGHQQRGVADRRAVGGGGARRRGGLRLRVGRRRRCQRMPGFGDPAALPAALDAVRLAASDAAFAAVAWVTAALSLLAAAVSWLTIPGSRDAAGSAARIIELSDPDGQPPTLALATFSGSVSSSAAIRRCGSRSRLKASSSSPFSTLPTGRRTRIGSTLRLLTISS